MTNPKHTRRLPSWFKMKMPGSGEYARIKDITQTNHLHTICASGNCPNIGECWSRGTATFMILGNICTRACKFCGVPHGKPLPPDLTEAERVAGSIRLMKLKHCVITSVDRDDLADGGAKLWADTIRKIKELNPATSIEALIPDFMGNTEHIDTVIAAAPDIISHNLETVERLTPAIRSVAQYRRSLAVLHHIAQKGTTAKSGIMLGLGETEDEIYKTMDDLLQVGCNIITIGQYLQPTLQHLPVARFYEPELFDKYHEEALKKGFTFVESGPLVRSSYYAEKHIDEK